MKWLLTSPMVAFDVETTGVDVETERIVTAAVITLKPNAAGQPWEVKPTTWLINPGIEIPAEATAIHGISTEQVRSNGAAPVEALEEIAGQLVWRLAQRWALVGFNLAFDLTILDRELRRHALPPMDMRLGKRVAPCVDPYVLDKHLDPYRRGSRKLTDLCAHYGVTLDTAHDASADALAAARLAYRIAQLATGVSTRCPAAERTDAGELDHLATLGKAELHAAQIGWRAGQVASLANYFRSKGQSADDVDDQWPQREWKEPTQ
jgi:DNA polymerase-3 subunit epsilon